MATVVVTPRARLDLETLIVTHSLPASTRQRVRHSIEPLATFPFFGAPLEGRWATFRFILGPWRWMIIVYAHDPETDEVAIVTIQDGRSARAATSG